MKGKETKTMNNCVHRLVVLLTFVPGTAFATGQAILNGGTLQYEGPTSLRIGWGTAANINNEDIWTQNRTEAYRIDGSGSGVIGSMTFTITYPQEPACSSNFINNAPNFVWWDLGPGSICPTQYQSLQQPNTVYYVYTMSNYPYPLTSSTPEVIISQVPPYEDGYPHDNIRIMFENNNGACGGAGAQSFCTTGQIGTFVGSFMTDGSSNIIPFQRVGDAVYLLYTTTSGPTQTPWLDQLAQWSNGAGIKTIGFGPGSSQRELYPVTASGLILDLWSETQDSNNHDIYVLDPRFGGVACPTLTDWLFHLRLYGSNFYPFPPRHETDRIVVPTPMGVSSFNLEFADCGPGGAGYSALSIVHYAGYIEPVHHLNQVRTGDGN
jgi:hypothetical protein